MGGSFLMPFRDKQPAELRDHLVVHRLPREVLLDGPRRYLMTVNPRYPLLDVTWGR